MATGVEVPLMIAIFAPSIKNPNASLKLEPTYSVYSSDPKIYEKETFPSY